MFEDGELLGYKEESSEQYIHSEKLTVFVDGLFKETNVSPSSLSAVCISSGPGSYTGLRIGTATAKGICFATDASLLAVNTLRQLAAVAVREAPEYDLYVPMLDARRMEVYAAVFDGSGTEIEPTYALIIDENALASYTDKSICIFGDGASKSEGTLSHLNIHLAEVSCSARNMGELALLKLQNNDFEDLAYFEPFYLKEFVAGTPKKLI